MADGNLATFDEGMAAFALAITIVLARNDDTLVNGGDFAVQLVASNINNLNINSYDDINVQCAYLGHAIGLFCQKKLCIDLGWKTSSRERSEEFLIPAIGGFKETSGRIIHVPNFHNQYTMSIDLKSIDRNHEQYTELLKKIEVMKNKLLVSFKSDIRDSYPTLSRLCNPKNVGNVLLVSAALNFRVV
jgi:hypothetical protein